MLVRGLIACVCLRVLLTWKRQGVPCPLADIVVTMETALLTFLFLSPQM